MWILHKEFNVCPSDRELQILTTLRVQRTLLTHLAPVSADFHLIFTDLITLCGG